jgi:isopentenyl-diphosphate Delta-isomerase
MENDEALIVVDESDRVTGFEEKEICHQGDGILHRAITVFIFDESGRLLLQKRSSRKPLWPQYWSGSVCSHPRRGETYDEAASRRLYEEIGLKTDICTVFKFRYHAHFDERGSEKEICTLFAGVSDRAIRVNADEIDECRFVEIPDLGREIELRPEVFTPWFILEWKRFAELRCSPLKA